MTIPDRKPADELTPEQWLIRVERLLRQPELAKPDDVRRLASDVVHLRSKLRDIQTLANAGLTK